MLTKLTINGKVYEVELQQDGVVIGGVSLKTSVLREAAEATVKVSGRPYKIKITDDKTVLVDGRAFTVQVNGYGGIGPMPKAAPLSRSIPANGGPSTGKNGHSNGAAQGDVRALMPGTVLAVRVREGEEVAAGAVLLILEAMKMQNEIKAPHPGVVRRIAVAPGQTVRSGDVMLAIE